MGSSLQPRYTNNISGINRLDSGKLIANVEYDVAKTKASYIPPVPSGVGSMTVASLIRNTLSACEQYYRK